MTSIKILRRVTATPSRKFQYYKKETTSEAPQCLLPAKRNRMMAKRAFRLGGLLPFKGQQNMDYNSE
jgi:hypothetical protein